MKIASDKKKILHGMDVITMLKELEEKYRYIYWTHVDDELYVYKPIGRRDFKNIFSNDSLSNEDKQDEMIKKCILYPEDFDIDDCFAGLIDVLFQKILEVSYLDSEDSRAHVIDYYRSEMFNLDNQITCIINEAFPQFDIEDIENWDIERTSKYLSRAEWKLQNLRGMVFNEEFLDAQRGSQQVEEQPEPQQEVKQDTTKKDKMTPEKLRQLKAQFPEIDWENDAVMRGGVDAMADSVDTMAPALRPGMF